MRCGTGALNAGEVPRFTYASSRSGASPRTHPRPMTLLRKTLKAQAALWAVFGLVCLVAPASVGHLLIDQTNGGTDAIIRVLGVAGLTLAMTMILVAQHPGEAWWWAWAFALLEAGVATVCILHAVLGVPDGLAAWPWWVLGLASSAFAALDLVALARAEQSKPFT